ncbi:MAG: DUF4346 domain-containing protein [Methanoregula sp.]|nr:DUF4346 domain-containing protein [Methanoregula sp.]
MRCEYITAKRCRTKSSTILNRFQIGIKGDQIVAVIHKKAVRGKRWQDVLYTILSHGDVTLLDHAGYLGRELHKAEMAIRFGRSFEQDGEF